MTMVKIYLKNNKDCIKTLFTHIPVILTLFVMQGLGNQLDFVDSIPSKSDSSFDCGDYLIESYIRYDPRDFYQNRNNDSEFVMKVLWICNDTLKWFDSTKCRWGYCEHECYDSLNQFDPSKAKRRILKVGCIKPKNCNKKEKSSNYFHRFYLNLYQSFTPSAAGDLYIQPAKTSSIFEHNHCIAFKNSTGKIYHGLQYNGCALMGWQEEKTYKYFPNEGYYYFAKISPKLDSLSIIRHFRGGIVRAGLIQQSLNYHTSYMEQPEYLFYSNPNCPDCMMFRYPVESIFLSPVLPDFLSSSRLNNRTHPGVSLEQNHLLNIKGKIAHVLNMILNYRIDFLFPAIFSYSRDFVFNDCSFFNPELKYNFSSEFSKQAHTGVAISPKINIGLFARPNIASATIGYAGEYRPRFARSILNNVLLEYSSFFNSIFLNCYTIWGSLNLQGTTLHGIYHDLPDTTGIDADSYASGFALRATIPYFNYIVRAKQLSQRLVDLFTIYGEFGYFKFRGSRFPNSYLKNNIEKFWLGKVGCSSYLPFLSKNNGLLSNIDIIYNFEYTYTSDEKYLAGLAGIRIRPVF